ncbi:MAG: PspC domain-containing protein [Clostridia bacterium]|nr:PspC domain-containing protein [Clostridia bacterium]
MEKKLYKSRTDKKLDGVCAGVAEYLDIDPTVIRLLWILVTAFAGAGLLAYIIAAIVMPRKPEA